MTLTSITLKINNRSAVSFSIEISAEKLIILVKWTLVENCIQSFQRYIRFHPYSRHSICSLFFLNPIKTGFVWKLPILNKEFWHFLWNYRDSISMKSFFFTISKTKFCRSESQSSSRKELVLEKMSRTDRIRETRTEH